MSGSTALSTRVGVSAHVTASSRLAGDQPRDRHVLAHLERQQLLLLLDHVLVTSQVACVAARHAILAASSTVGLEGLTRAAVMATAIGSQPVMDLSIL